MPDTVNAVVTRARGINGQHADGDVIELPEGQFEDWRKLGWVDRATAEQIEADKVAKAAAQEKAEKAEQAKAKKAPAKTTTTSKAADKPA